MDKNQQIDDLVTMLDQFMGTGGGHMNVRVEKDGSIATEEARSKTVTQFNSLDCTEGDMACRIPNLFKGLDTDDDT